MAAVTAAPFLIGSVHTATTTALAGLVFAGLWLYLADRQRPGLQAAPLTVLLAAVALWIAFSLVPLPASWHAALSPAAARVWDARLAAASPSLSLCPGATSLELVEAAAAVAVFALATGLGRRRQDRRWLVYGLVASGLAVAGASAAQTAVGAHRILGVYTPQAHIQDVFRTPFVNPNHAAEYFELVGFAALGLVLGGTRRLRMAGALAAAALLGAALATGSEGAQVVVPTGLAAACGLALGRRWPRVRYIVPTAVLATLLALLLACAGRGPACADTIERLDHGKLDHLPAVSRMVRDHAIVGVGRGAFRDAFAGYPTGGPFTRYTHAESELVHLVAELGIPLAVLLVLGMTATWFAALARWRVSRTAAGALLGTFAVGVHSIAEFGLEFAGTGLPFVMLLGLAREPGRSDGPRQLPRRASLFCAGALTLTLLAGPVAIRHGSCTTERANLSRGGGAALDTAIGRALRWHPNSPDVAYAIALELLAEGAASGALTFLNRCMVLDPANPLPHLAAAHALERLGADDQAALEAAAALHLDSRLGDRAYRRMARVVRDADQAADLFRDRPDHAAAFAEYMVQHHPDSTIGADLVTRIAARSPDDPTAARLLAATEWSRGERAAALDRLAAASEAAPCDRDLARYHAALRRADDDAATALSLIDRALGCEGPRFDLLHQRAMAAIDLDRTGQAQRAVREMRNLVSPHNPHANALILLTEARIARAQGHHRRAVDYYRGALDLRPDRADVRLELGEVLRDSGQHGAALEQFRIVRDQGQTPPYLDAGIDELETQR